MQLNHQRQMNKKGNEIRELVEITKRKDIENCNN